MDHEKEIAALEAEWKQSKRWKGIHRNYPAAQVLRLRGSVTIEHTLARLGALRLWNLMETKPFIRSLGALTGNQAVQMVEAGLPAIYLSGWQVAGDANTAGDMYPDQSLYPADSVPAVVKRINNALRRADQIRHMEGRNDTWWFAPIVADAEGGFGGNLNAFELMKHMIEAGAAGVHFEDQVSSQKKCGHMGGKVLVPTSEFISKLQAARLAADIEDVPTILVARTDADGAQLLSNDIDERDHRFMDGTRTSEGYYGVRAGLEMAIERARSYAPHADLLWCETSRPDIGEAREFAQGVHEEFPGKPLAYNLSPSFNWRMHMDEKQLRTFQDELGTMGYKFQFVTLAGFHALNASMFELARGYLQDGMVAYSTLQEREIEMQERDGYSAVRHQRFVGAGYFDEVQMTVTEGSSSTAALKGSTEEAQFSRAGNA